MSWQSSHLQSLKATIWEEDDPNIYTDGEDIDSFYTRREWADKILPATSSSVTFQQAADQAEIIQSLPKVHHVHIKLLKSLGLDPSKSISRERWKMY